MLVNGGVLNGKRLLSPRTVDLMASNHVGDLYTGTGGTGQGHGLRADVEVVLDHAAANRRASNGSFGWDGAFGTHFWVDRKEQLVGVLMFRSRSTRCAAISRTPSCRRSWTIERSWVLGF